MVSESQRVMRWMLILKEFGPNIQHIAGIYNVVADMLGQLPSANSDQDELEPGYAQCHTNDFFVIGAKSTLSKVFNEQ